MDTPAKRNYLSELAEVDWDFAGTAGNQGFAGLHWYPGRFVPQVPGILLGYFTSPGDVVLDPFCGSGTTLVEAKRLGRSSLGIDTNPVATQVARAKTTQFTRSGFSAYCRTVLAKIDETLLLHRTQPTELLESIPNAGENSDWYHPDTLLELSAIWHALVDTPSKYSDAGWSCFSAVLRFSCSQEKHWGWICDNVKPKELIYRNARRLFTEKLHMFSDAASLLQDSADLACEGCSHRVETGRAQDILVTFDRSSVDSMVTSPPYYGVTDYVRSQRLTLLWTDLDLDALKQEETGARFKRHRKAGLASFLDELESSFKEAARVLRVGAQVALVVGESASRGDYISGLIDRLAAHSIRLEADLERRLPRQSSIIRQLEGERILVCRRV